MLGTLLVTASLFAQVPAVVENRPGIPVQIVSMTPTASHANQQSPPGITAAAYDIIFQNTSTKKVMLLVVNYRDQNTCGSHMSIFPDQPLIAPGGLKTEKPNFGVRGGKVTATIDLVLLEDGTAYGPNLCRHLEDYQSQLSTRRATIEWVLRQFTAIGPQQTEALLRKEAALRNTTDKLLLNPKFVKVK